MSNNEANDKHAFMFYGIQTDIKNIIATLKFRRLEKGYSQRDLAKLTGIKQSAIARLEQGKIYPRIDTIIIIGRALDLQVAFKRISTGWDKFSIEKDENNE